MSEIAAVVFVFGWLLALFSLWRVRSGHDVAMFEGPIAVVIPARDEAANIGGVLASLSSPAIVVDDHSSDTTAKLAVASGARVIAAPQLPAGWAGKCWACHTGASVATDDMLAFVDADVRLAPGALARLATIATREGALVSVQPWHDVGPTYEQLSMMPNLAALMGSGVFALVRSRRKLAFGPVLVTTRAAYDRAGGFEAVRGETVEDVALARRYDRVRVLTGRGLATFRMHHSPRQFVDGWTRVLRRGVGAGSLLGVLAVIVWIGALVAGFTSPWLYALDALGLAMLSRVAGRFRWYTALLYPIALAVFVLLCLRSLVSRRVMWRGRQVLR